MFKLLKLLRKLNCRKGIPAAEDTGPKSTGEKALPPTNNQVPALPTDVMLYVFGFVGDRTVWHTLISLNKAWYQASKKIPAPWPNDMAIFGRKYTKRHNEDIVFSKDSQWLCLLTQSGDMSSRKEIHIQIWDARTGPKQVHTIKIFEVRKSRNWRFSDELKYLAVYCGDLDEHYIRVYDLISPLTHEPDFDPSRYIDFERGSEISKLHKYNPFGFFDDTQKMAFANDGKVLVTAYETYTSDRWNARLIGQHIVLWDVQSGTCIKRNHVDCDQFFLCGGSPLMCLGGSVLWTNAHYVNAWNFSMSSSCDASLPLMKAPIYSQTEGVDGFHVISKYYAHNPVDLSFVAFQFMHRTGIPHREDDMHEIEIRILDLTAFSTEKSGNQAVASGANTLDTIKPSKLLLRFASPRAYTMDLRCALSWFPDGEHLAFIRDLGLEVFRVNIKSPEPQLERPCPNSLPARLIAKANEAISREIALQDRYPLLSWGRLRRDKTKDMYNLYNFHLAPDGKSLIFHVCSTDGYDRCPFDLGGTRTIPGCSHVVSI
jgi:WD40 repeat protein